MAKGALVRAKLAFLCFVQARVGDLGFSVSSLYARVIYVNLIDL